MRRHKIKLKIPVEVLIRHMKENNRQAYWSIIFLIVP